MKKILKYIFISLACFMIFTTSTNAEILDGTLADIRQELNALKEKKKNQNQKTAQTKAEQNETKNRIYNSQEEIKKNQKSIDDAKIEIANLNIEISKMKESIKKTMNSHQVVSGENIYLEYIFNSNSYADLVYRYAIIEQIVKDNDSKINSWDAKIQYNEELQVELAAKEKELQKKIKELEKDFDFLGDKLSEYTDVVISLDNEIQSLQETIDLLVLLGCGENDYAINYLSGFYATGFSRPLVKGTITSPFGYRTHPITGKAQSFHGAIDIGGNSEGTKIYATATGVVGKIISDMSKPPICGGKSVYIWHDVKGKFYTSAYLHLLDINVKVGDVVNVNTVVGTIGGGRLTPWDNCSTGAHLHFVIATGWYGIKCQDGDCYTSQATYSSRAQDPTKYINFPKPGVWWYSRY